MSSTMKYNAKGVVYVSITWIFTLVQILVVTLRIYSRTFLTRSVGSDDFFIVIALMLKIASTTSDLKAFLNGFAQHESVITPEQYSTVQKWIYISYIEAYIVYFFVRASVMLFVLRLLPSYKKRQQMIVNLVFVINLLVTSYTCITFGISCIPINAYWETVPRSRCFSVDVLVITNQINAAFACVCDIATALIPQFLLWNVQMRAQTKRQLSILFGLGLVTAALSIARAATITKKALNEDTTWNMVPAYYFSMFELNLGIIFACGPAIRQFWAYRKRTHTSLPTKHRQYPNEDFVKMRYRVNLRDIFWYRRAQMVGNKVSDATPIFRRESPPPHASSGDPQISSRVSNSILDVWEKRIKGVFGAGRFQKVDKPKRSRFSNTVEGLRLTRYQGAHIPTSGIATETADDDFQVQKPCEAPRPVDLPLDGPRAGHGLGLFSTKSSSGSSNQANVFVSTGEGSGSTAVPTQDESFRHFPGTEHVDESPASSMDSVRGS